MRAAVRAGPQLIGFLEGGKEEVDVDPGPAPPDRRIDGRDEFDAPLRCFGQFLLSPLFSLLPFRTENVGSVDRRDFSYGLLLVMAKGGCPSKQQPYQERKKETKANIQSPLAG